MCPTDRDPTDPISQQPGPMQQPPTTGVNNQVDIDSVIRRDQSGLGWQGAVKKYRARLVDRFGSGPSNRRRHDA
jgi:hypothetical protein